MRTRATTIMLAALLIQGCTSYIYSGAARYADDAGAERCYGVQWSLTRYAWIYKIQNDSIDLRLAGGSDTIHYAETRDGGIVSRTEADETVPVEFADLDEPGVCGRVLDVENIRDVQPGPGALKLTFRRAIERDAFTVGSRFYPAARQAPYVFEIARRKTKNPQAVAQVTPVCD